MIINIIVYTGCRFCYTKQPIASLECDPYDSVNKNITINCAIDGPVSAHLDIKWFFEGSQADTATLITPDPHHAINKSSTITSNNLEKITSQLTVAPFSAGQYWCQVFYGNNGLPESQHLEVLDKYDDRLSLNPCVEPLAEAVYKCNDIISNGASYSTCPFSSTSIVISTLTSSLFTVNTTIATIATTAITSKYSSAIEQLNSNSVYIPSLGSFTSTSTTNVTKTTSSYIRNPVPSNYPVNEKPRSDSFRIWVYMLGGLVGFLVLLIIVLSGICIGLCVTKPKRKQAAERRK